MTAVAVQHSAYSAQDQHPNLAASTSLKPSIQQQSRRSSAHSTSHGAARVARDGSPANGSSSTMTFHQQHTALSGAHQAPQQALLNGNNGYRANDVSADDDSASDRRPSTAPGNKQQLAIRTTSFDDSDREQPKRRSKPPLLRSKSEHIMRNYEETDQTDDEVHDWSARHGFEDHYQSEDIISHLANVSCMIFVRKAIQEWLRTRFSSPCSFSGADYCLVSLGRSLRNLTTFRRLRALFCFVSTQANNLCILASIFVPKE